MATTTKLQPAFSFRLLGSFHSGPLYDNAGQEVHTLVAAKRVVEEVYGEEWAEVFNGIEGETKAAPVVDKGPCDGDCPACKGCMQAFASTH